MFCQIVGNPGWGALHPFVTGLPACRADLSMLIGKEHGIDHSQHLIDVSPQGQIIDHLMTNGAITVEEK